MQKLPILRTFKDAASEEIAWFNAYTKAKQDGFNYAVKVIAIDSGAQPIGPQTHYFPTLKMAQRFVETCKKYTDYWKDAQTPKTIDSLLKQCWS